MGNLKNKKHYEKTNNMHKMYLRQLFCFEILNMIPFNPITNP